MNARCTIPEPPAAGGAPLVAARGTHQRTLALPALAVALLLAGCERVATPAAGGVAIQIDSSGAVPVVTVSGEAPEWTLESLAVIRADPEVGFSRIRSIALDPRGGVWVADTREERLSRWGDNGRWMEDLGRVGSGPGEFRTPNSIAVHANRLYLHDVGNARVVRFDLAAASDTSWLIGGRVSGDPMSVRLYPNPDEPLLFDVLRTSTSLRRIFFGVVTGDTLLTPLRADRASDTKVCPIGDRIRFFSSPFSPSPLVVPVGKQVVSNADDGSYRLNWHDGQGTLQRIVERAAPRALVTDAEYDVETVEWRQFSDSIGSPTCDGELVRYAEKPSIRALLPDGEGRLWVEQQRPDGVWYELWRRDSLLARVAAPERSLEIPPAMLGDRLAVARSLPDGGQEVQLFRIRTPSP